MDSRRRTGSAGEAIAAAFLRRRGAQILARNVEVPEGEIDLVADIDGVRTAVEVRTRWYEDPLEAFDDSKLGRVHRSAARLSPACRRVDLITIRLDESGAHVRWIRDV